MRMRHLAGSPPEQTVLNPGKVSLNFTGKSFKCSASLLQLWPVIKKHGQEQEESAHGMESQTEGTVLKKGELHTLKAEWKSLGEIISFCLLAIVSPEGNNVCSSPPLQPVSISVGI